MACLCVCVCIPAQGPAYSENKPEVPQMKLTHAPRPLPPHLCLATAPCLPGAPPTQATHQPIPHPLSRNRVSATASTQSQIPSPVALGACQASPASSRSTSPHIGFLSPSWLETLPHPGHPIPLTSPPGRPGRSMGGVKAPQDPRATELLGVAVSTSLLF